MRRGQSRLAPPVVLLLALLAGLLAGCHAPPPNGPTDTYFLNFPTPKELDRCDGAIVFFVDGVNSFIFQEMLQAGELPAIQHYFVDRGLYAPHALSNIPSITLPNETAVVTGLYPGHHGITANRWFDRQELFWRDYESIAEKNYLNKDFSAPTIFQMSPDRTTLSIFYEAHRGATRFREQRASGGPVFLFHWYEFMDRITLSHFRTFIEMACKDRKVPAVTFVYLLAPDFRAYAGGTSSPKYREALRHTDRQVGRVLGDLERAGLLDGLHIVMTSDHGFDDVHWHFMIEPYLRDVVGLDLAREHLHELVPSALRQAIYNSHAAMSFGGGDQYEAICLRRPVRQNGKVVGFAPWADRPTAEDLAAYPTKNGLVDLPKTLVAQRAVIAVTHAAGPGRVRVVMKNGTVEFCRRDDGCIVYQAAPGSDPLCWSGKVPDEMLAGRPATAREWLAATIDTDFPGLPGEILAYFEACRAGDIAVFSGPGYDFDNHNCGGHGGIDKFDMTVPLLIAGPGVPHCQIRVAQSVDLLPTLLTLTGRCVPPGLDGQSLVEPVGHR